MESLVIQPISQDMPDGPLLLRCPPSAQFNGWMQAHRVELLQHLARHGGILFRGTGIREAAGFEAFAGTLVERWMDYKDRASRRSAVAGNVYSSTDTPASFAIPLHTESSFTARWPRKIFFFCERPAERGGRTPIADTRRVYRTIDSGLRARFEAHGVMYLRNFSAGVGMDWRDVFQVADREALEAYCAQATISLEWLDEDRVRTLQVRPATISHPETGERSWFNHAMALHSSALDPALRQALLRQGGEWNLPHNTYFGNGDPIRNDEVEELRRAHQAASLHFDWQAGDVLVLDNLICAHGRESYEGERRVLAALADPGSWAESAARLKLPEHGPRIADVTDGAPATRAEGPAGSDTAGVAAWFYDAVAAELRIPSAAPSDRFREIGGDSLAAVALADLIFERHGLEIDIDEFFKANALADIVRRFAPD